MKIKLLTVIILLLPTVLFGAANDTKLVVRDASNSLWAEMVIPDPNSDKFLMWDDSEDEWVTADASGGSFDATAVDTITWSDGGEATILWTWDLSGTDRSLNIGSVFGFSHDITVPGDPYSPGWNSSTEVATKNDIYDKIEAISLGGLITPEALPGDGVLAVNSAYYEYSLAATDTWTLPTSPTEGSPIYVNVENAAESVITFGGSGDQIPERSGFGAAATLTLPAANNSLEFVYSGGRWVMTDTGIGAVIDTESITDDAVTAAKLADTAVTPGAYTSANITVDAQGRITAAASGSPAFDATAETDLTWSDGTDTDIVWTFDVLGTDTTVTFGDGTIAFSGAVSFDTLNATTFNVESSVYEGSTEDEFETTLAADDPTADNTITLPDESGTVALVGKFIETLSAGQTLSISATTKEGYDSMHYVDTASTQSLPVVAGAANGASWCLTAIAAVAITINPDDADQLYLDGTLLDAGDSIISDGTLGATCVVTYINGDGYYVHSDGLWSDNG